MSATTMRKLLNILNEGLTEAPISDIQLHGDFSQPGTFQHEDDRKVISSPKAQDKLKRLFRNTPFNFVIHYVNLPHPQGRDPYGHVGSISNKDLRRMGIDLPPGGSDEIRVVLRANEGIPRHPLTPWIVGHRFCHAMENGNPAYYRLMRDVKDAVTAMTGESDRHSYDALLADTRLVNKLGSTGAGRKGEITNVQEFVHECTVQWLIHNRVRLNSVEGVSEDDIGALEDDMNRRLPEIIKGCVGRTFIV